MDDTKRPDVAMHMEYAREKPYWRFFISTLAGRNGKHYYSFNWDAYYNQSYAEMTMYPNNSVEMPMFMLTWPDVRTLNSGLFATNEFRLNEVHSFRISTKWSFQHDGIFSDFGLKTLPGLLPRNAAIQKPDCREILPDIINSGKQDGKEPSMPDMVAGLHRYRRPMVFICSTPSMPTTIWEIRI